MTLELYNFAGSTCSQAVRFCLAEKGIEWIDRRLVFSTGQHLSKEYLTLNPNGVVPTLVHNGIPIIDSTVIMEYLDEEFPEPPMMGESSVDRAKVRAMLRYLAEVPQAAIRYPSFNKFIGKVLKNRGAEEIRDIADRHPLRKYFYRQLLHSGILEEDLERANEQLRQSIERVEKSIAEAGPWLVGNRLTIADAYLLPIVDRLVDLGMAELWEKDCPRVGKWYEMISERPAFSETYYPGSRLSETYGIELKS